MARRLSVASCFSEVSEGSFQTVLDTTDSADSSATDSCEDRDALLFRTENELSRLLARVGIDVSLWGQSPAKTLRDLFWEIQKRECELRWNGKNIERYLTVLKIFLHAETSAGSKVLMETGQRMGYRTRDLHNLGRPLIKKIHFGNDDDEIQYQEAALRTVLGLLIEDQRNHLVLQSREERQEGPFESIGYPGLLSHYIIIERHIRVKNPTAAPFMLSIGLPHGVNFDFDEEAVPQWIRHMFAWADEEEFCNPYQRGGIRKEAEETPSTEVCIQMDLQEHDPRLLHLDPPDDQNNSCHHRGIMSMLSCCLSNCR